MIAIIKTEAEYNQIIAELEELISVDPDLNTPEGDRIEILTLLIQEYEKNQYQLKKSDPIEAILFRMEQQNLTQRDLIPYFGSRSKVSEVLSRKRPLSLSMIRALHEGLGIPAVALLADKPSGINYDDRVQWDRYPFNEMVKRGWIKIKEKIDLNKKEELLNYFFSEFDIPILEITLYRSSGSIRSGRKLDEYALQAWTVQVIRTAMTNPPTVKFIRGSVNLDFMRNLARLSWSEHGPIIAQEYLRNHGIALVIEPQLPGTLLDGAAIMYKGLPIIGMTLRYDRIDNFWFTLQHECAHLALHLDIDKPYKHFFDNLDVEPGDKQEYEADELASEALIPSSEWKNSPASTLRSQQAAEHLARKLHIHPAIVAGRIRHHHKAYRLLNNLVGNKQVRICFPEKKWSKED